MPISDPVNHPPLVAVVIVTKNRRDDLAMALESVFAQSYEPLEVIVYDDASDDGSAGMVRQRFPRARVVRMERGVGYIQLRNRGFRDSSARYIFSLDDDAYFASPDTVERIVHQLDRDVSIAAVALPFVEPKRAAVMTMSDDDAVGGRELRSYVGCAHAIRRTAALAAGGYREFFIHQGEERDLCIRLMNAGGKIIYGDCEPVVHTVSPIRDRARVWKYSIRNTLLFSWLNLPLPFALVRIASDSVRMFLYKFNLVIAPAKICYTALALCSCVKHTAKRGTVAYSTYARYRRLPRHGPVGLPVRIAATEAAEPPVLARA